MSCKQSDIVSLDKKDNSSNQFKTDELKPKVELSGNEMYYVVPKIDKSSGDITEVRHWLCAAFDLIGSGKDDDGNHYRIIKWIERGTSMVRIDAFPMRIIGERDGWSRMRSGGLTVTTNVSHRAFLGNYMQLEGSIQNWNVVSRSGWQYGAYVLPNAEVLGDAVIPVFFNGHSASANAYRVKGNAQEWREQVGYLVRGNICMMLGVACALAAPMLDLIEADSFGVHLFGNSGTGKTTIGMVANSVWGHPEDLKLSWYSTSLGLANEAVAHNDGLMSLDEIGQSTKPKDVATSAYTLFNGIGKIQGAKDGGNREAIRWRVLALSTGEKDLETFLNEAGEKVHAGHLVRLLNIPIQKISDIHGYLDSRSHADATQQATRNYYGSVGREWVNYLSGHKKQVISSTKETINFWQARLQVNVSDQVRRVATRFAILDAALISASEFTGWTIGESKDAIFRCFESWIELFGVENKERRTIIDQSLAFLNVNGLSRYSSLDGDCNREHHSILNLAGYRIRDDKYSDRWIYYTFQHVFESEISKGFNCRLVAQTLVDEGILEKEKGKRGGFKKKGPKINGVQQRFYVLKLIDDIE